MTLEYACCGIRFPESLGKYGCPNCCGDNIAIREQNMSWQDHRMFTPEEYLQTVWRLGMTQTAAGRFLGVSERTSRRYVRGEAEVPPAQVLLLRAMLELKAKPQVPKRRKGQS